MVTKFSLAEIEAAMPDNKRVVFYFDGNGKITREHSSFVNPVPNAFSLVQVEDCPFATPICKSVCYVHGLEKAEKEIHAAYQHNSRVIREVLTRADYREFVIQTFAKYISKNAPSGFRWHVAGDIFSVDYSQFICDVCVAVPAVPFWLYTRSFAYLEPLLEAKNLIVNLSTDKDNWQEALGVHEKFGFRLCYLTVEGEVPEDLPEGSVIFPSYELRGRDLPEPKQAWWWHTLDARQRQMVCPTDFFGQSEALRCGPCQKCLI
ncbi:MAG TPA: hypothetical protein ENI48_02950 [Thioploca sp.]|nr:hypothetical protein [Thioploca sp.]